MCYIDSMLRPLTIGVHTAAILKSVDLLGHV